MDVTLKHFRYDEINHLQTQLSLSKLALLASDSTPDHTHCEGISEVAELNRQLDVVEYQYNIPDSVMEVSREREEVRERVCYSRKR